MHCRARLLVSAGAFAVACATALRCVTPLSADDKEAAVTTPTSAVEIGDLRWQPRWISEMGCLRPALEHLGREVSWPWLYGGTGYAFLLNIHEELCPSGWHVAEFPIGELGRNLGIQIASFTPGGHEFPADEDLPRRQKEVWEATRQAIDRGQPCYGYNLEIGDYYVVYGYDDVGYHYSGPRCEAGKGPLPWQDYGPKSDVSGLLCMGSVAVATTANEAKTVRGALAFAVAHARTPGQPDDVYRAGLAGYDQWIRALKAGRASTWGAAYNAACYLECREAAVGFLKESKGRLGGEYASSFDEAIRHYEAVVASLREVAEAFPTEGSSPEHLKDQARVERATAALKAAQTAEAQGVEALGRIVAALDGAAAPVPEALDSPALKGRRLADVGHADGVWGAGLPTAIVRALREHGEEIDYCDLAAGSGWAFSFSYDYGNWHTAGLHFGLFDWLPRQLGYEFEAVSGSDLDATWEFITGHLDRGTPVVTTLGDGGLVHAYRVENGKRQFLFDGEPMNGWLDFGESGIPSRWDQWGVLTRVAQPRPRGEVLPEALARAVQQARPHEQDGVPRGMAALQSYLADVENAEKSFDEITEWFCWATFERLTARGCAAQWLRHAAATFEGEARGSLLAAADSYQRAFEKYVEYDRLVHEGEGSGLSIVQRLRTPEKIARLSSVLRQGIEAEEAATASLQQAVAAIEGVR
jgi:hypothetical protein